MKQHPDRLEASLDIDLASPEDIVRIISSEDQKVAQAVAAEAHRIAQAIESIADRLRNSGKLFYVGAGTSGRIAMLDASEIPPTYGTPRDLVQVIMAGGEEAFTGAVEGAEDDEYAAIAEVDRRVKSDDAVVGIAASGTTPFTVAAARKANMIGALTVGVTSRRNSPLERDVDIPIVVETGPEVILGSSRMKSGTAQKMVLNMISTGVMIQLGRTYSNLMVDMPATNAKLRKRASLMVELGAEVDPATAARALEDSGGEIRTAIVVARKGVKPDEARELLQNHTLREILQSPRGA